MSGSEKGTSVPALTVVRDDMRDDDVRNPWGKPVIGWNPITGPQGQVIGFGNPTGFAAVHVVHQRENGDGQPELLYDQFVIVENPGAIVVIERGDGAIALIQATRKVGSRIISGANYVGELMEAGRMPELIETLGAKRWEVPRGIPPTSMKAADTLEASILKIARLESLEEAGIEIEDAQVVGVGNTNPTFFPHAQYIVHARVAAIGQQQPEELEEIGPMRFFFPADIRRLAMQCELDDMLTFGALAMCGIRIPTAAEIDRADTAVA
ncbi:MAG: hypothetical protein KC925_03155 [Candidatus Doudnabacteria bacterium]|nr:hypothetical protein [Candidatus Doudnabacteria bacterium]